MDEPAYIVHAHLNVSMFSYRPGISVGSDVSEQKSVLTFQTCPDM